MQTDNTSSTVDNNNTEMSPAPDTSSSLERFELELEFIQSLANPFYLHYLAQQDYFDDPCFITYLDYLSYWRKPEYAKFIVYPHCLHYLELLQHEEFRQSLRLLDTARMLHSAQYKHWRFWREGIEKPTTNAQQPAGDAETKPNAS